MILERRRMGVAGSGMLAAAMLGGGSAGAQPLCYHLGQPVICPAGITPGSTSLNFTGTGIHWSDGNDSVGFSPSPYPSGGGGGGGAPMPSGGGSSGGGSSGGMPTGDGFTTATQQAANTLDLDRRPGGVSSGLSDGAMEVIAESLWLFARGDWLRAYEVGSLYPGEETEQEKEDRAHRASLRRYPPPASESRPAEGQEQAVSSTASPSGDKGAANAPSTTTVTVDDKLVDDLINRHLPGEAGQQLRDALSDLSTPSPPTFTDSSTHIAPTLNFDASISYLESKARFREQMAEHERESAERRREQAERERDFARQYRDLADKARQYADEVSDEQSRQDWLDRAEEHEQSARRHDAAAETEDQRAAQDDARAAEEQRQAREARELEQQREAEAQQRYEEHLTREAAREQAIQQRLADLAAAEEAARKAAEPPLGSRENPHVIDISLANSPWAREVTRMEQEIQSRADGDIYWGFYDPRIPAALDSEYLSKQDQYFEFNGRVMNGGELNYYFQGMYWAKAGLPEWAMDGLIYGWKAIKYATDEKYTRLTPSANDIAAAEAGHDDFW